jgi:diadenosine tetraphosphate (Ap4A) HIT family hydrolase
MSAQASDVKDTPSPDCPFCSGAGGEIVWEDVLARVILAGEADHPGYCRVVLNRHARELTDLPESDRTRLMRVVFAVEAAQRALLAPDKVNLASFGNQVPHVHWHVIPRFGDDPHFPNPTWGERTGGTARPTPADYADGLRRELARRLS